MKKLFTTFVLLSCALLIHSQCFDTTNVYSFNYNGHSYKIVKENKDWNEAANCAVADMGYLTEINNLAEQNAIFTEITMNAGVIETNTENQYGTSAVWIGGSDSQTEGTWIWDGDNNDIGVQFWNGGGNGTPVGGLYSYWGTSPLEPDNNGDQDKLTLTIDSNHPNFGKWNDLSYDFSTLYYIIEYNDTIGAPTDTTTIPNDTSILAIEDEILKDEINIYPNPFNDFIYIDHSLNRKIISAEIFNNLGQLISKQKVLSNSTKMPLQNIKKGLYHLNLTLADGKNLKFKITRQ